MTILLETRRLVVKTLTQGDYGQLLALQTNLDVMQHIDNGVRTAEEVQAWLDQSIQHQKQHGFSVGSVYEKETNLFIGHAGLVYLGYDSTQPEIEIDYVLTKAAWGKGYALELARAFLKWGFQHLTVDKLVALIQPQNEGARRILEKVNMHYQGRTWHHGTEVAKYEILRKPASLQITLEIMDFADYPMIQNMARFYTYDISEFMRTDPDWVIPSDGLYECIDFKRYWHDGCYPLLIRVKGEMAGFALIDQHVTDPAIKFNMAQFFVLRKFIGLGVGRFAAHHCFAKYPGTWQVRVLSGNENAYRFWRKVIKEYTKDNFTEQTKKVEEHGGFRNIFFFDT